jgi:rhodanese-related sulfurtransferase
MPYMKTIFWIAGLASVVCVLLFRPAFLRAQGTVEGYPNLSPPEARETIGKRAADSRFVLLDVRTPKEYGEERIAGAVMIDYLSPAFRDQVAKLDREKTYLVYCRTGNRSNGALKVMRELGFRNLLHLAGGITKWKEAGFPTAR